MQVTSNVYQRIHALNKADFREMRAELKHRCGDAYYAIAAGNSAKVSSDEIVALKRVYGKHKVCLNDDEIVAAVYMTMARSAELR